MNQTNDVGGADATSMMGASGDFNMNIQDQLGVPPVPPIPDFLTNEQNDLPGVDPSVMAGLTNTGPTPITGDAGINQVSQTQATSVETQNEMQENATGVKTGSVETGAKGGEANKTNEIVEVSESTGNVEVGNNSLEEIKKQMLQDLYPLMDKIKMQPEQKFKVYRQMIETTGSKDMISSAYEAAKGISDEVGRAEALLFLVEKADN